MPFALRRLLPCVAIAMASCTASGHAPFEGGKEQSSAGGGPSSLEGGSRGGGPGPDAGLGVIDGAALDALPGSAPDARADAGLHHQRGDAAVDVSRADAAAPGTNDAGGDGSTDWTAVDSAIARGIGYCDSITAVAGLEGALWYLYRKFGIPDFANARSLYDVAMISATDRVYRRIVDRSTVPSSSDVLQLGSVDLITYPALYCDTIALPGNYVSMLTAAGASGSYDLTHTLLAALWLGENGCTGVVTPDFVDAVERDVALIATQASPAGDIQIESQAFLYTAGRRDLVDPTFVDRLVNAQLPNGGWSISGAASDAANWHPSALALWVLLSARHPEATSVPVLDPG